MKAQRLLNPFLHILLVIKYIDSSVDDMGTQMDVGLLLMEAGDTYVYEDAKKEVAILLFSGSVTYEWDGKKVEADRPDCFHHDAYCLLAGCGTKVTITAKAHSTTTFPL